MMGTCLKPLLAAPPAKGPAPPPAKPAEPSRLGRPYSGVGEGERVAALRSPLRGVRYSAPPLLPSAGRGVKSSEV